jgi:DNA-binding NarL/FixJ family response regulator
MSMERSLALINVSGNNTTVLVADDQALVRYGLRMLVTDVLGPVSFVEAEDFESLMQATHSNPGVQLALIDVAMRGMRGGLRLLELARRHPAIPVVVVSTPVSREAVQRVMRVRTVLAFVPKSAGTSRLRAAIEVAMDGRKTPARLQDRPAQPAAASLTLRQQQIRGLLRQGLSNKMIARALGISEGTVKNHITDIFRALNTTNRTQAAHVDLETE